MVIEASHAAPSPSPERMPTSADDVLQDLRFSDCRIFSHSRIATCPSADGLGRAAGTRPACL